jgi:hypothetical protein
MKEEDLLVTIAQGGEFDVTEAIRELSKRVLALEGNGSIKSGKMLGDVRSETSESAAARARAK